VAERFKDDPNVETFANGDNVFPFFQSGTPATDEYRAALSKHGGGKIVPGVGTATGWVAGKLLEKAGAGLPEPPTSQAILQGLWSLKNNDLGGITLPLTFAQGQTAAKMACWFNIATKSGSWVSPDGFQRHCAAAPIN
jgi:branched-chain amino acid transport system substrate-binding protein